MKSFLYINAILLVIALTGTSIASDKVSCPETIKVEQKAISQSSKWSISYDPSPHRLEMVTFFNGPPSEMASLIYDQRSKIKGGWVGTWKFPKDERGYWIRCSYSQTSAELSRSIPDSVTICRVTYDETSHSTSGLPAIRKIECH